MNTVSIEKPQWFIEQEEEYNKELEEYFHSLRYSDYFLIKIYSNVVKRIIIEAQGGNGRYQTIGVYDFSTHTYNKIYDGDNSSPLFYISGNGKVGSFVYFQEIEGFDDYIQEYTYGPLMIMDAYFNNAPNIGQVEGFDKDLSIIVEIINDYLYFEYKGTRYLINGDYKVIAKLPYAPPKNENSFLTQNTKQIILWNNSEYYLYDMSTKQIVFDHVKYASTQKDADILLENGDIYKYNNNIGEFVLSSKYDPFISGLKHFNSASYGRTKDLDEDNARDIVHVYSDQEGKFYLVHNNTVINKNCPFEKVILEDKRWVCIVNGFKDIYIGFNKWKFNSIDLDGSDQRPWFDTED